MGANDGLAGRVKKYANRRRRAKTGDMTQAARLAWDNLLLMEKLRNEALDVGDLEYVHKFSNLIMQFLGCFTKIYVAGEMEARVALIERQLALGQPTTIHALNGAKEPSKIAGSCD